MKLEELFKKICDKSFWSDQNTLFFKGSNYPFLFINNLFKTLEEKNIIPTPFKNLIINSTDKIQVSGSLQQSFLGETTFYWLGEYKFKKTDKTKIKLIDFLLTYNGPNFAAIYINEEKLPAKTLKQIKSKSLQDKSLIELKEQIDFEDFKSMALFFGKNINEKKLKIASQIFKNTKTIPLDAAISLMNYLELISVKMADSFYNYISSTLIQDNPSLTNLAEYFFAKNPEAFFSLWSKIYQDYPEMFWVAFWSEQIWKAHYVVKYLKQKNFTAARSLSFRLPYSFINKDWKKAELPSLQGCYKFLYSYDFALKTGSTFCALDLFYLNYFTNNFTQKV